MVNGERWPHRGVLAAGDVIRLETLWVEGNRGGSVCWLSYLQITYLPVHVQVPGRHTAMNNASCGEDVRGQVDEQPPLVKDSGGWPHICSSGASVSSESCGQRLASLNLMGSHRITWVGVPVGVPQAVVVQHGVTGRIQPNFSSPHLLVPPIG